MVAPIEKQRLKPTKLNIEKLQKKIVALKSAKTIQDKKFADLNDEYLQILALKESYCESASEFSEALESKVAQIKENVRQLEVINRLNKNQTETIKNLNDELDRLNYSYDRLLMGLVDLTRDVY